MSLPAFVVHHRRLLCIGALSLAVHMLVIALVGPSPERAVAAGGQPLAVRLAQVAPAQGGAGAEPAGLPAQGQPPPASPAALPVVRPRAKSSARSVAEARSEAQGDDGAPPVIVTPMPAIVVDGFPSAAVAADAEGAGTGRMREPGEDGSARAVTSPLHFRIAPAPSARLAYTVWRSAPGGAAEQANGSAQLEWTNQGTRYELRMEGVLGAVESEGEIDDSGIAPQRFVEPLGAGTVTTRFDREQGTIVAGRDNSTHRFVAGSQDSLSVLAQLSAIGSADGDQLQGELVFWTGDADGARAVRFQALGREQVATGAGVLDTVHLVRLPEPDGDQRRLDVWLAPAHRWLPVQLRVTGRDGVALTQTVATIEIAPVPEF